MAASNVPSMLWSGAVNPFVIMWGEACAISPDGSEIADMWEWRGQKMIWPTRHSNTPVWMSGRGLDVPPKFRSRAMLRIEMWDEMDSKARFIGAAAVKLSELALDQRCAVRLDLNIGLYGRALNSRGSPCVVYIRPVPDPVPTRHVFFLRHGESKWNRAQSNLDLKGMWSTVDHPLNDTGRDQAASLRDKIVDYISKHRGSTEALPAPLRNTLVTPDSGDAEGSWQQQRNQEAGESAASAAMEPEAERALIEMFLNTTTIWASPLTRATCTALVALEPLLCKPSGDKQLSSLSRQQRPQLVLTPNAREKRTLGGKDSSGCAIGDDAINGHIRGAMDALFASVRDTQRDRLEKLKAVQLETLQCREKWWSSYKESNDVLSHRIDELFSQIRYCEGNGPVIVVGHSFYIRQVIRKLSGSELLRRSVVAERLSKHKVGNAGLLHCEMDFTQPAGSNIKDLHLMFGSYIEGASANEDDDAN